MVFNLVILSLFSIVLLKLCKTKYPLRALNALLASNNNPYPSLEILFVFLVSINAYLGLLVIFYLISFLLLGNSKVGDMLLNLHLNGHLYYVHISYLGPFWIYLTLFFSI